MPNLEVVETKLSEIIIKRMEEKGLTINDVAKATGVSYEHMRRIARGIVPSRFVLKAICDELKLPFKQLDDWAEDAKMLKKFGDRALKMAGKIPSMEPLERIWNDLSEAHQQDIVVMAQGWVKRTKTASR